MVGKRSKAPDPKWKLLLSEERLRPTKVKSRSTYDARTAFENDYDRVIFCSSFRRLRNKAQVFSLEGHDFVRTRLTHSIEVSTIGRALGDGVAKHLGLSTEKIGSLVATVCLLHDIGNPPFGHSGEHAIGSWFKENFQKLLLNDPTELADLTAFEGNAQAFRIATRTQWSGLEFGLNLTAATLSTLIKYPCSSTESRDNGPKALSKFGYFTADKATFDKVRHLTGLKGHTRHPLTFLMEAADDIAYATGDLEDVLKKGLVDYRTIREIIKKGAVGGSAELVKIYLDGPYEELSFVKDIKKRQQLSLQRFCQMAVRLMIKSAIECFITNSEAIINGQFDGEIVGVMGFSGLCKAFKTVMREEVYPHLEIAHREQASGNIIHGLLAGIFEELIRNPKGTLAKKVYVQAPSNPIDVKVSEGYQYALRMTDYVSGMTDAFALSEYQRMNAMGASL